MSKSPAIRTVVRALLSGATAATIALTGCGQPQPSATGTSALQSADNLDDVMAAKGGAASWGLFTVVAHDNDLSGAAQNYFNAAQSLANTPGIFSAMVHDSPGQGGVRVLGYNGQWINGTDKEINSGSADFVNTFLSWTGKNFPTQQRALFLADHGGGIVRGIMVDDGSGHAGIDIPDLAKVLQKHPVGILAFDACLMQMIEVAYEVREGAKVVVAAESVTYAGAWPYAAIGGAMSGGGSPDAVARRIVDAVGPHVYRSTISGVRTEGARDGAAALDRLAKAALVRMKADPRFKEELVSAIGRGQSYKFNDDPRFSLYHGYRDLVSVARELSKVSDPDVAAAAKDVQAVAKAMVIRSWRDEGHYPDSNGVSVYAPIDGVVDLKYARNSAMAADTQWDEFLVALNSRGNFGNPLQKDRYPGAFPTLVYPGR